MFASKISFCSKCSRTIYIREKDGLNICKDCKSQIGINQIFSKVLELDGIKHKMLKVTEVPKGTQPIKTIFFQILYLCPVNCQNYSLVEHSLKMLDLPLETKESKETLNQQLLTGLKRIIHSQTVRCTEHTTKIRKKIKNDL